jgi:glucose 1-dehydrogenase
MTTSPGDQQPAVTVRSRPIPKVLVGQKALVTGANSGIGRAVAVALGQAGADVVVNYVVGEDAAEQVVGEIRKCGSNAYARKADVSPPRNGTSLAPDLLVAAHIPPSPAIPRC